MLPSSGVSAPGQFVPAAYAATAVFLWGASDFSGGLGSRRANAFTLTAFSHVCAFALMMVIALAVPGEFPSRTSILWALAAGAVGGFSLAIFYRALAAGQMGVTAPIAALLGAAIPTLVDIAMEGAPSRWSIAGFVLAILAIWLITRPEPMTEPMTGAMTGAMTEPMTGASTGASAGSSARSAAEASSRVRSESTFSDPDEASDPTRAASPLSASDRPAGIGMAALAGVGFAGFYLCIHQASGSPVWVAAISRVGSFTATAIAVVATRAPLAMDRPRAALGALAGCLDITASALFIYASQRGRLDQAVVITSLYPAVTVLLARLVLKEHFSRWRFLGLLAALAAVPLIAAG
jgi:drug/metabolite transporter (DMT)-like permease